MLKFKDLIVYFPSVENGGMEKNLLNMFNHIARNTKVKVHFFTNHINKKIKKSFSRKILIHFYKKQNIYNRYLISLFSFYFFYSLLDKKFSNKKTIFFSAQNSIAAILLCKLLKYKILVRNGNHPVGALIYSDNIFLSLLSFVARIIFYNLSNMIICNSQKSTEFFKRIIINNTKVKCISNSIAIQKKSISKKKLNFIVTAGRLTKQKNIETLIKAFHLFLKVKKSYKLLILGEGKEKKSLIKLTKNLNINKNVIFKNFISRPEKIFSLSKIYVCSSLYEGLPSSIIESLNCFTPVISSDCLSGPSEILNNGKYGYLFPVKDYYTLSRLLIYVANNYKKALNKTKMGQKSLKKYNIEAVTKKYINVINSLY